jgi:hypothetical protein
METYGNAPVRALTTASRSFYSAPPDGFAEEPLTSPAARSSSRTTPTSASCGHTSTRFVPSSRRSSGSKATPSPPRALPRARPMGGRAPRARRGGSRRPRHSPGVRAGPSRTRGVVRTDVEALRVTRTGGVWTVATAAGELSAPVLVNARARGPIPSRGWPARRPSGSGLSGARRSWSTGPATSHAGRWRGAWTRAVLQARVRPPPRLALRRDALRTVQRRAGGLRRRPHGGPPRARYYSAREPRPPPLGGPPLLRGRPDARDRPRPGLRGSRLARGSGWLRDPDRPSARPRVPGALRG